MHNLKEKLMDALYEYEERAMQNANGKISDSEIQKIHVITDTVKNIDKIEMLEEASESSYADGNRGGGNGGGGNSYARGRGRNARRDSMGRYAYGGSPYYRNNGGNSSYNYPYYNGYSREEKNELAEKLREMMNEAGSEEERSAIKNCIRTIEDM